VSPGQDSFYGQSWALFHYLHFASEREGQLAKYQQRLAAGDSVLEAAEGAFGDLDRLEKDVEAYTNRRKLSVMMIDPKHLAVGEIALRTLGPAEAEMMPVMMQSKTGVTHEEALQLLAEARRIAAKYPDDPAVLTALAESEFDADFWDAAIAAADRALALDANRINAHIQKGYAMFSKAQSVASTPEATSDAWKGVRGQFLKANKVENDHPVPLLWFYSSYLAQGEPPSRNAVSGLEPISKLPEQDA
jgi:tetratricopeptide (TPR) repeat protein